MSYYDSQGACEGAGYGYTWQARACNPVGDTPEAGLDGQFWTRGPAQAKIDQCSAFHRLQYDSCYDPGDDCLTPDGLNPKPDCETREPGPYYRDGVCQVNTGLCTAGTDCSDCPSDPACPGVGEERFTPCRLPGLECDKYVMQQFGAENTRTTQCGWSATPSDLQTCAPVDCPAGSAKSVVASVLYIDCPDVSVELGAAMGYLFVVQVSATALIVITFVLATGGSFKSAWDHTRSVLRADLATEEAESQKLLEENRTADETESGKKPGV